MKKILCAMTALCMLMLCACGAQPVVKDVNVNELMGTMLTFSKIEDGMLELTQDDLLDLYGIKSEDVKQFAAQICINSLQADEIVLIEAVDAQAAARVKEKLDARYQTKLNENRDYLVDEFAKIEKCEVRMDGNFVSLIVVSDAEGADAAYKAAVK
jgi:hypothetical protein